MAEFIVNGKSPQVQQAAFVAPNATLAGEVVLQPKLRIRRSCGNQKSINVLFE